MIDILARLHYYNTRVTKNCTIVRIHKVMLKEKMEGKMNRRMQKRMKKRTQNRSFVLCSILSMLFTLLIAPIQGYAISYNGSSSYQSGKYYTELTNVTLTGDQRTDMVNIAKSQIGYQESGSSSNLSGEIMGNKNYTEYGRWYGAQTKWCAIFISWCANQAGVSTNIIPKQCDTVKGLQWYKDKGIAYTRESVEAGKYTPQAGDIIYFKSSGSTVETNRSGIVTKYANGKVYTIEGNSSSADIETVGGAVVSKSYSIKSTYIAYICSPAYVANNTTPLVPSSIRSMVFDASYYANKYSDLKKAYGIDSKKLFEHFVTYGIKEGRKASPYFDITYYMNKNPDIKKKFGTDYEGAMRYFAVNCVYEPNRLTAAPVNLGECFITNIRFSGTMNLSVSENNVITDTSDESLQQQWKFIRQTDGTYKIVNESNGYCLNVEGGSKVSGRNVITAADDGTKAQRWYIYKKSTNKYVLRPACSSTCALDVTNGEATPLTNVRSYKYTGAKSQSLEIEKVWEEPVDLGDNFCAKISTTTDKRLSLSSKNVILYKDSKAPAQVWRFVRQSDESYMIVNQKTGECLNVQNEGSTPGSNVQIYAQNESDAQRWYIYYQEGKYVLVPKNAQDCAMDIENGVMEDLTNIQINTRNNTNAQKFKILKVNYFETVAPADLGTDLYYKITASSGKNLSLSGSNVILYPASTAKAQQWKFVRQTDGSYKLVNQKDGTRCLDVNSKSGESGANVQIADESGLNSQSWFIYLKEGKYMLRPACSQNCVLNVEGGKSADLTNIEIYTFDSSSSQLFTFTEVSETSGNTTTVDTSKIEVIRKIIYAVETGGQVYGNVRYDAFIEAYANTSTEVAITIGGGQWYGVEAKRLLNLIRNTYPDTFKEYDTAGIADDLDNMDWSVYRISKTSAKAKCIQAIISTPDGIKCQDQLLDDQMITYMKEAAALGVTQTDAQMMCANIRHQGGLGAVKRILGKTTTPYTLDHIYTALQSDTGNQVGTYTSRQKMVYTSLKKYVSE